MKIGIVYTCIYNKIAEETVLGRIHIKRIKYVLGKLYHIPKEQRMKVIREFEEMKLLIPIDGYNYSVNKKVKYIYA